MRRARLILLSSLIFARAAFGQICPEGMSFFNNGEYRKAAESLIQYSQEHANQRGICLYYAGESFYNLGLEEGKKEYFSDAVEYFRSAGLQPDLQNRHESLLSTIDYKIGWASFRLYESGVNPTVNLETAISKFSSIPPDADAAGTYGIQSEYMKGESQFRLAALKIDQLLRVNDEARRSIFNQAVNVLNASKKSFESCSQKAAGVLKLHSLLRMNDIDFQRARLLLFDEHYTEAAGLLTGMSYDEVKKLAADASILNSIVLSEMQRALYLAFLSRGLERSAYLQNFNDLLASVSISNDPFLAESNFFQGARDKLMLIEHVKSGDSRQISSHLSDNSYFARAAGSVSESFYWQAIDHLVSQYPADSFTENANGLFLRFLGAKETADIPARQANLRDDAIYYILKYAYERAESRAEFQALLQKLNGFQPKAPELLTKKDLLVFLVNMQLSPDSGRIWNLISQDADVRIKCERCFQLIDQIFRFATQTVGRDRAGYLKAIDALFVFTESAMPVKTKFYRGMKYFLQAEIQTSKASKKRYFLNAARELDGIGGRYGEEGRYIYARSYFEAARNSEAEAEKRGFYTSSADAFSRLVENSGSLRSLFYLAEIRYIDKDFYAAKIYLEKIRDELKDSDPGSDAVAAFLHTNVLARLRSLGDAPEQRSDLVGMSAVTYPDVLLRDDSGNPLSLEKFVGSSFMQEALYQESLTTFLKYSYDRKGAYCSVHRLYPSRSDLYAYQALSAGIDEAVRDIHVDFRIKVALPPGVNSESTVFFNDQRIESDFSGYYTVQGRQINEEIVVKIMNDQCYFYQSSIVLDAPGLISRIVSLNKKFLGGTNAEIVNNYSSDKQFSFSGRFDNNIVMHNEGNYLKLKNEKFKVLDLTSAFVRDIHFRDFVYSDKRSAYLAVNHNVSDRIIVYNKEGNRSPNVSDLKIAYENPQDTLISPEGITISSRGDIFVVDYSGHRVLKWNPQRDANAVYIGSPGKNTGAEGGGRVKFEYPKRIALVENVNSSGTGLENQTQILLFVSDRRGIHQFDENGFYHSTIIPENIATDDITALSAEYVLNRINVYFADRRSGDIYKVVLSPD